MAKNGSAIHPAPRITPETTSPTGFVPERSNCSIPGEAPIFVVDDRERGAGWTGGGFCTT